MREHDPPPLLLPHRDDRVVQRIPERRRSGHGHLRLQDAEQFPTIAREPFGSDVDAIREDADPGLVGPLEPSDEFLRGILDDKGRPMVLVNWNTDMGDGVEWSNAQEYQGYIKWTAQAYQMLINEVIYSLTH